MQDLRRPFCVAQQHISCISPPPPPRALLAAAETAAREAGRTLLVLDTVTGGDAERLYERSGWVRCGVIPNYALFPDGRPCATTVFYKQL